MARGRLGLGVRGMLKLPYSKNVTIDFARVFGRQPTYIESAARRLTGPYRRGRGAHALGRTAIESEGVVHEHFNTRHCRNIARTRS